MNSKGDPILFLKKDNHFNDSIDRSLVNEYTNKTSSEIIREILDSSIIIILPILSIFITEITNIIIFTYDINEKTIDYINLIHYIIVQIYYFFFGYIFFLGAMKYFGSFINYDKREMKLKQVYYSFSRIFYFFSAMLIILPLSLGSYFILTRIYFYDKLNSIFWEFYLSYMVFLPLIFYTNINFHLNLQLMKNLKKSFSLIYIFNFFSYIIILYFLSIFFTSKIGLITSSVILNSFLNLIISHYELKRNITYLKDIQLFIFEDLKVIKWESFFNFMKYSMIKGMLFNFRYFAIAILIYTSFYISNNYLLAVSLSFIVMFIPHLFSLGVSKFYKSYLENSVYDHSQKTKERYLRYYWWIMIVSAVLFMFIILLFKSSIFRILLNLYIGFFEPINFSENSNLNEIFYLYDKIVKYYSIFIIFDFLGNGFQEILKAFNDHSRNFLSFYKGISVFIVFYPIGLTISYFLDYEIFWGFWIAIYQHMIVNSLFLMIILFKNYKNSTFPSC